MSHDPSGELEAHLERMKRDGYTVVERAIDPETTRALRDDVLRLEHALSIRPAPNLFEGLNTLRIYNLLARGAIYQQIPIVERRTLHARCARVVMDRSEQLELPAVHSA